MVILPFEVPEVIKTVRAQHLEALEPKDKKAFYDVGKGLMDPILYTKAN